MSRWIDVDAFVADARMVGLDTAEKVFFALVHQPSIDIVRCRECKHREEYPCKVYHDDDWFCADGEFRHKELCEECYEYLCEKDEAPKADRKTEPQKIGYCNECKWYGDKQVCGRCRSRNLYAPKTEPINSEKPNNCDTCKNNKLEWYSEVCDGCSKAHSNYEPKDEPQTDYDKGLELFANILFDKEKSEQFLEECKAMGIEPQTEREGE